MNLRTYLVREYSEEKANYEAAQAERRIKAETAIKAALEKHGITGAVIVGDIVQADDLTLKAEVMAGRVTSWQLKGQCPHCGQEVWSEASSKLYRICKFLDAEKFKPQYDHRFNDCKATGGGPLAADRLAQAIIDLVKDELGE